MKFPQTGKIEHTFGKHMFGVWGAVVKCENAGYRVKPYNSWVSIGSPRNESL